jgi:hypothetical protein
MQKQSYNTRENLCNTKEESDSLHNQVKNLEVNLKESES